jgi:O-antigen biosynthesis protein
MSFIAPTRSKKFKKLILLAHAIISQWGFRYFFYLSKLEWKKQGWAIFLPDIKPVPLFYRVSFQEQYEKYLNFMEGKFLKASIDSNFPKITFLLNYESKEVKHIQNILDSFLKQSYDNWNLVIISKNNEVIDSSLFPQDERIYVITSSNNKLILDQINSLKSDFVGIIDSHVVLPSYSLTEFAKFLKNNPNFDIFYSDHDNIDKNACRHNPFFKPSWSLITFRSFDYISSLCIVKQTIMEKVFTNEILSNYSFDLLLNCIDKSFKIYHVPLPLYSITDNDNFISFESKINSLEKHLQRNNIDAKIEIGILPNTFRINYNLKSQPKVSIFIPTKNNKPVLQSCIGSIEKITNYKNFEIIIINNPALPSDYYYDPTLSKYYEKTDHKVIHYDGNFNFSKMNNIAVKESTGDLLLFLNDDTKILDKYWLDEMVSIMLQPNVGVVGTKLLHSDDTLQHAGMSFLKTGAGFHPFVRLDEDAKGYQNFANIMKECTAVTGACLLTTRDIFEQIDQFDEEFDVYYGDSDLCLKIRDAGYMVVYTPFTKLLHDGSRTIRRNTDASYFAVESHQRFIEKWPQLKNGDPFYHPALDWDYSLNIKNSKNSL